VVLKTGSMIAKIGLFEISSRPKNYPGAVEVLTS
jgi:hypothetical protein